ncbi:glycosyltransferase family 2 protein [Desulfocurvibacter africanus]|uniref:Glycosyl transferase family 2 n=1 Tax=Desulfocurvibacter africanus subsp. africanus str. Walvis Bay TaxID=690850 RepID=F3YZF3_DESAF|nr:glycosyltransferase family 2 protein [Desulfocurvibacter africanus]EGJ51982.1 glycosyl transferase family 2 [Desulfocurvibacter africanus subsp. africanus str. Walvis Bay]
MRESANTSVIIPVFNKWELTSACLESLAAHSPGDIEVIVVDNGSTDETRSACGPFGRNLFGNRFRVLHQERNLNFAPACNIGARAAQGMYLLFLNNDTLVTPGWLSPLQDSFRRYPKLGAVGPLLLYPAVGALRDRVQHLGICFEPQFYPQHLYEYFPADHPAVRRPRVFQALTAAALLMPAALFFNIGMFDEAFINGGEDVELGLRIRQTGNSLVCEAGSRVYHLASQTPGRHDHEQHNARILKERALDRICPDMHLQAGQDGYECALTPWLKCHIVLPVRRKRIYEQQARKCSDVEELRALLDREPLWLDGYDLVATHEEAAGNLDAALTYRFIASRLMPHPCTVIPLHKLALRVGDQARLDYTTDALRSFATQRDVGYFLQFAAPLHSFLSRVEIPQLADLYRRWLDERSSVEEALHEWGEASATLLSLAVC